MAGQGTWRYPGGAEESSHNQSPCASLQVRTPCPCTSSIFQLFPPPHFWLLWSPAFRSCDMGQWQRGHRSDPPPHKNYLSSPGFIDDPDLQSHVHAARSMKATHCGETEARSREGACLQSELGRSSTRFNPGTLTSHREIQNHAIYLASAWDGSGR